MEYIIIPTKSKSEKAFFLDLLKKMQKEVALLTDDAMEDIAFTKILKESEKTGKGSMAKVKSHLSKVASGK
jgi:hypothetical protein